MKNKWSIILMLGVALLFTSCLSVENGSVEELSTDAKVLTPSDLVTPNNSSTTSVTSNSNIVIKDSITEITSEGVAKTNIDASDAIAEGYDYGDILRLTVGSKSFTAPIVSSSDEVNDGSYYIIFNSNGASIGRRNSDLGLSVGDRITFEMEEKEGFLRTHILHSLKPSGAKLTDLTHYEAGSMKKGHLFTVYAPLFTSTDSASASALLEKYNISAVVDLSEGMSNILSVTPPANLEYTEANDLATALRSIISLKKPYLIVLGDNTVSYHIVPILEALLGGRLDQIISDCLQPYCEYYGLSSDSREYKELANMVTDFFTELNKGTVPRDKSLLSLAVTYLRSEVGLSVDEISSLRLSLR